MSVDEAARHQLYNSLESTLGPEPTSTLMSLLPPVGWADVATKQDLNVMESRLRTEFHDAMRKQTIALFTGMITLYGIAWATITFGG